ncbi:hypothetical protein HWV62_43134 [Athelia sp. TMB]|nr:hypothetical protein HWV62_43134 [Athelia sp. TMB]
MDHEVETNHLQTPSTSSIRLQLLEHRILLGTKERGEAKMLVQSLVGGSSFVSFELWKVDNAGVLRPLPTSISFELSSISQGADVADIQQEDVLLQARRGLNQMDFTPSTLRKIQMASGMSIEPEESAKSFVDVWGSVLEKLELFAKIIDRVSKVRLFDQMLPHLFIKAVRIDPSLCADCMLHTVSRTQVSSKQVIIAQQQRDNSVFQLMETINDVHSFLSETEPLNTINTHRTILEDLSSLTLECSYLIRDYTSDKKFRERLLNLSLTGVVSKIEQYNEKFKELKRRFNEHVVVRIDIMTLRCLEGIQSIQDTTKQIESLAVTLIINDLPFADGGAFDPAKVCIPGTREFVLEELHQWINKADADDVPKMLVLTGIPGFGKSVIANTLAQHYHKVKRLGSFVSFSRADQARRHPGNLLSTISRDIADLDPYWRVALCDVAHKNRSLAKGRSPMQQMEELVLGPAQCLAIAGPVVIIIDALDESGNMAAREPLLQVLSQYASSLPRNFRILVTARPEKDIVTALSGKTPYIQHRRLDTMDLATIDLDIAIFIEQQLSCVNDALDKEWSFRERWLGMLVKGSGHVFQWAATTCRAIREVDEQGVQHATRLIAEILEGGESLDDLYRLILGRKCPERDVQALLRFKRVMGCILAAKEPLSKSDFVDLCCGTDASCKEDFETVLAPLGSLMNGVSDDVVVTARHASFFDFLTDESRSLAYFIDPKEHDQHFASPCLRILNSRLTFNIGRLKSSYTSNAAIPDLPNCVTQFIGPVLAYAARFFGRHLEYTPHSQTVMEGLRKLLKENLLHWLEVLSLLKQMGAAPKLFASILKWVQAHDVDSSPFVEDVIQFVETFAAPIAQSMPHIYLSALPFAPTQSLVSQTYLPQYPFTARLKAGKLDQWPAMLKTFEGHTGYVWSVAYSPNGKRIASASADGTIQVRDPETGEAVGAPFRGHTAPIRSIAYSPSGHSIVSGSEDGTVRMWDSETGEAVRPPFEHSGLVSCVAYSRDGKYIISGSCDDTIRMWDAETGGAADTPIRGTYFAYSSNGSQIIADRGARLCILDVGTGKAVGPVLKGHNEQVYCVVYSPDGTFFASSSVDSTIRLWETETRVEVGVLKGHTDSVFSVAYSPDGEYLVSGSRDKTICVWDVKARKLAGAPLEGHASAVFSVAYSPDGTHIVSGSADGTVRVWDAAAVGLEAAGAASQGSSNTFLCMAYSPDGASIISGSEEGKIQIWDVDTAQQRPTPILGHRKGIYAVSQSPDGARIVSGSADGTMQVWDALTGEAESALEGHTDNIYSVAYSPDGSQIVSCSFDGTGRTWDAESGEPLSEPFEHDDKRVWSVAYSPDGAHIVSGGADKMLRIWNVSTNKQVGALSGHKDTVTCVAYSPDGTRIASGSWDNTVRLWDAESGGAIGSPLLGHDEMIESVAFSPDGKNIVSGSRDQTVRMWDAETREPMGAPIKVHGGIVVAVTYSPDGMRIASASANNTIRIWDLAEMEASADSNASPKFRHDCKLENGWIMTASSELLLWVPPWNRQGLVWPGNITVIGPSPTELDLADFVHGLNWESCKIHSEMASLRVILIVHDLKEERGGFGQRACGEEYRPRGAVVHARKVAPLLKHQMTIPPKPMPYVRLGKSGLKISKIILGCMTYGTPDGNIPWALGQDEAIAHIKAAYDAGINTFDTANVYSGGLSEIILGNAIKQLGLPRDEIVVMTKAFCPVGHEYTTKYDETTEAAGYVNQGGLSRKHIFEAIKNSLDRLQLDYVDVFQCHRFDPNTPIEETMHALHDIVKAGYTRYIGMSSCYAWQFQLMQNYALANNLTPFISMQNCYSLLYREEEREMMPTLTHFGVGSICWWPLAGGILTRPWLAPQNSTRQKVDVDVATFTPSEADKVVISRLEEVAKKLGSSMAQTALAWLMAKPAVCAPIVGTSSIKNLHDVLGTGAVNIKLSEEDVRYLDEPYEPKNIMGH